MVADSIDVDVSEWRAADIEIDGQTVFAVGDVHGCAEELRAVLQTIRTTRSDGARSRRLVFLGDLIDRGPDSIGALQLWASDAGVWNVDGIDRLMGNHEQLLLMSVSDLPAARKAERLLLEKGGDRFLDEMRRRCGAAADEGIGAGLLERALGRAVVDHLRRQSSHVMIGNAIFVHAGVDPAADVTTFLEQPWTAIARRHWAWIVDEFLTWEGGHGGRIVVHGHTPPDIYREVTGRESDHTLRNDQLCLDGGSAVTGIVAAAQIEDGRYRIIRARRRSAAAA
jgi:serine/threonine protein phosphatase 1